MTSKFVARWSINWADEMDIEGSAMITADDGFEARDCAAIMDDNGYDDEESLTMWVGTNQSIEFKSFKDAFNAVKVKALGKPSKELNELIEFAMTDSYCVPFDFIMNAWANYQADKEIS